jgi:hypothetical protein
MLQESERQRTGSQGFVSRFEEVVETLHNLRQGLRVDLLTAFVGFVVRRTPIKVLVCRVQRAVRQRPAASTGAGRDDLPSVHNAGAKPRHRGVEPALDGDPQRRARQPVAASDGLPRLEQHVG